MLFLDLLRWQVGPRRYQCRDGLDPSAAHWCRRTPPIETGNLLAAIAKFLPPDEKRILISSGEPRSYLQLLDNDTPHPITPPESLQYGPQRLGDSFWDVISDAIGSHSECLD